MNKKVLKTAEQNFLTMYPGGFLHPEMVAVGKKHKMDQLTAFAMEAFAKENFAKPKLVLESAQKLVSRSTLVSMFEKPKFRTFCEELPNKERKALVEGWFELLHGKEKTGFEAALEILGNHKLAKWPLATVVQSYYRPTKEVFIKPTTAKLIVTHLELDMVYKPTPSWDFYRKFRKAIKECKSLTTKELAPNNPAYCGFLMMTLGGE